MKSLLLFNALFWLTGPETNSTLILAQSPYALYWLKGPVFYRGSKASCFILAQGPCVLYWLEGPVLYTGSEGLCFILAQRPWNPWGYLILVQMLYIGLTALKIVQCFILAQRP